MTTEHTSLHISGDSEELRIEIVGEIDHHSARSIREGIDAEIYRLHPRQILLDLGHVSFMDSSGLGLLLGRLAAAEQLGSTLKLVNVGERIKKILHLAGASRMTNLIIEHMYEEA